MIDPVHLHLALTHVPVVGIPVGAFLVFLAWLRKSRDLQLAASIILAMVALATIPLYLTGEQAEEAVEHLPGVSESVIERHEGAADVALVLVETSGLIGLVLLALYMRDSKRSQATLAIALLLTLATSGVLAWTANLGGQVRHSEIRAGAGGPGPTGIVEEHDDD